MNLFLFFQNHFNHRYLHFFPTRRSSDLGSTAMPFIDTSTLEVIERRPGWYGRYFHSPSMTFAHYDFKRDSSIHEHFHAQEEVYEVIEGELELTIDGVKQIARLGLVGIVPSNVRHSVKALTDGRAIVVDYPLRTEIGDRRSYSVHCSEIQY